LGSHSKQNAETLKTCEQQNADETSEHRTPAVALTQPYIGEAKDSNTNQIRMLEFQTQATAAKLN
jgi:hypothetical protein